MYFSFSNKSRFFEDQESVRMVTAAPCLSYRTESSKRLKDEITEPNKSQRVRPRRRGRSELPFLRASSATSCDEPIKPFPTRHLLKPLVVPDPKPSWLNYVSEAEALTDRDVTLVERGRSDILLFIFHMFMKQPWMILNQRQNTTLFYIPVSGIEGKN